MKLSTSDVVVNTATKTAELGSYAGGARQLLREMAADLIKDDGTVKSGYLKLTVSGNEVRIKSNHVGSGATAATDLVKKLVQDAYGADASAALARYLEGKGKDKVGTLSFVKLIRDLEANPSNSKPNQGIDHKLVIAKRLEDGKLSTANLVPLALKSEIAAPPGMDKEAEAPLGDPILRRGTLTLKGLPAQTLTGLKTSRGVLTKDLMHWLINSGQLKPQLDPQRDRIELEELERTGASTLALMMVKVNGENAFVVKECGNTYVGDNGEPTYFGYHRGDGGAWFGQAFEDEKLEVVHNSELASKAMIPVPGGGHFKLAMAAATFRYQPEVGGTIDQNGTLKRGARIMHQVNLLPVAQGKGLGAVLDDVDPATARNAAVDMGSALAAFHRAHLQGHDPLPTGGLRTLIHGDFHAGNLFYDAATRTITAIDLAGAAFNFLDRVDDGGMGQPRFKDRVPTGEDMLADVKRAVEQGVHFKTGPQAQELKKAFLQAYADAFQDIRDANGAPRYTVDSLSKLIEQAELGKAFT